MRLGENSETNRGAELADLAQTIVAITSLKIF